MSIEALTMEALKLPPDQRASLADKLVDSLSPADESTLTQAWQAEIARRIAEVESGRVKTVPAEQVFSEIRASLKRES